MFLTLQLEETVLLYYLPSKKAPEKQKKKKDKLQWKCNLFKITAAFIEAADGADIVTEMCVSPASTFQTKEHSVFLSFNKQRACPWGLSQRQKQKAPKRRQSGHRAPNASTLPEPFRPSKIVRPHRIEGSSPKSIHHSGSGLKPPVRLKEGKNNVSIHCLVKYICGFSTACKNIFIFHWCPSAPAHHSAAPSLIFDALCSSLDCAVNSASAKRNHSHVANKPLCWGDAAHSDTSLLSETVSPNILPTHVSPTADSLIRESSQSCHLWGVLNDADVVFEEGVDFLFSFSGNSLWWREEESPN